ncbi:PAS domain-containing protein [Streptomyces sp. NPDC094438]|uniref:PAS domain-containing protein n=1 Tax=Streptomyces sp. NPDC094438 TaxID=3366061 RepID=UPI00380F115D
MNQEVNRIYANLQEPFSALPIALWLTDMQLTVTHLANGPRVNYFKRPMLSAINPGVGISFSPLRSYGPDVAAHVKARLGDTVTWRMGRSGELLASVAPFRSENGSIDGVIGVALDVSEVEDETQRQGGYESLFHAIAENVSNSISITDKEDRFVYVNEKYLARLGTTRESILGHFDRVTPNQSEVTDAEKGSEPRWAPGATILPVKFGPDMVTLKISADSSNNPAEINLSSRTEHKVSALLTTSPYPQITVTADGDIEQVNPAWTETMGGVEGDYKGSLIERWIFPAHRSVAREIIREEGPVVEEFEILMTGVTGTILLSRVRVDGWEVSGRREGTIWTIRSAVEPVEGLSEGHTLQISNLDGKVLQLLALGKSNMEISSEAQLSRQGLDYRLKILRKKLKADSRGALVARAYHTRLLILSEWPPVIDPAKVID